MIARVNHRGLVVSWLWLFCTITAITSCVYTLGAGVAARRFANRINKKTHKNQSVTILKPLYGDEPELFENLVSFCRQDYAGSVQIIFGVQRPDDSAIAIVRQLTSVMPDRDIVLVIDERQHGANRKVSNLINMAARARHEIIVLADSDMRVGPDYLDIVVSTLDRPGVGLVTCLYRGQAVAGFWSQVAVQAIDTHFLPNVLVGLSLGLAHPCFGSTIALRRQTLDAIGGFAAVANHLADDYALGEAVRRQGLAIAIPPMAIAHCCGESGLRAMIAHEMRWARTIALVDPVGFTGSAITHTLPLSVIAFFISGLSMMGAVIVVLALACRLILHINIARSFSLPTPRYWLGPLRDTLSFGVFVTCFFARAVDWRGQRYVVMSDGTMRQSEKTGL